MENNNFKFLVFLVTILTCLILTNNVYSLNSPELYIRNFSSNNNTIDVKIYPISMVFNGNLNYDLLAANRETNFPYNYINSKNFGSIDPLEELRYNMDYNTANNSNAGAVGFGVYKIEITKVNHPNFYDTCTVEWDIGWTNAPAPFGGDLSIYFRDDNNDPRLTFLWAGGTETRI